MERSRELLAESKKYKIDVETLKEMKDKAVKEVGEASMRLMLLQGELETLKRS